MFAELYANIEVDDLILMLEKKRVEEENQAYGKIDQAIAFLNLYSMTAKGGIVSLSYDDAKELGLLE